MAARALRRGAIAASAVQRAAYSYNFNVGSKPVGMVEDAQRAEMLPLVISGGVRLQEQAATGGGSPLHWYAQHPGLMASRTYRATVTVGNQSSGTDRGCLVWVGGTDGAGGDGITSLVWFRMRSQSGLAATIGTKTGLGAAPVDRQSGSNVLVSPGDTIGLEITFSGGVYTYTGLKNGSPVSGCSWTDSGGLAGIPGKAWGCGGRGGYSGGYFPSLGVYAMSCTDL